MNKLMEQYELTKICVEGVLKREVERQHLPKFNIEQCRYLVEKLVATCESARIFMEIFRDQPLKKNFSYGDGKVGRNISIFVAVGDPSGGFRAGV